MEWNLDYFFKSKKEFEQEIKTVKKLLSKLLQMNENIVNSLQLEKILNLRWHIYKCYYKN